MSSWGYTDNAAIKGTVTGYTQNVNIVGSSTEFLTNVNAGDYLTISGRKYQVNNVISNTSLTLTSVLSGAASGATAYVQQGPKFLSNVNADLSDRQSNLSTIQNVYGVVFEEMNTQAVSSLTVGTPGNYSAAAKSNTTIAISTSGASQPTVNATATVNYTGANVTSFTITNPGAGYTYAAQQNTTVTFTTTGATAPVQAATATANFTTGTTTSNASHQGWVSYNTYTDANGGVREKSEVLVALSKNFTAAVAGDEEDVVFPD
jgi:hypothetical protein